MQRILLTFQRAGIMAFCFAFFTLTSAYAQTPTWTGLADTDWNNPGNWENGVVPTTGDIAINSTTPATLPAGSTFTSIILGEDATLNMAGNTTVEVVMFAGTNAHINTGANTLTLLGEIIDESSSSNIIGNVAFSQNISGLNASSSFGYIGVVFYNLTNADWGTVTVTRHAGTAVSKIGDATKQGINCTWDIQTANQPNAAVDLTLKWFISQDNDTYNNFAAQKAQVWKSETLNDWQPAGVPDFASVTGDIRSITTQTSSFSKWTVSDQNNPLPVSWLYFNGRNTEAGTELNWATATEKNTEAFIIERSENCKEFTAIGSVKASGNSTQEATYKFLDKATPAAKTYYRLKQTDLDGAFTYSKIIAVAKNNRLEKLAASVYPNPFSEIINLKLATPQTIKHLSLTTIEGKEVYSKNVTSPDDLTITNLPVLPAGIYLLNVTGEENTATIKVVRQ
jgi:hypothetical protein